LLLYLELQEYCISTSGVQGCAVGLALDVSKARTPGSTPDLYQNCAAVQAWRFFQLRIPVEEELLENFFGDAYRVYRMRTPTWIPFIP
jgi:protein-S-isoprenylcysteine O-methyltransferase Ste14